LAAGGGKTKSSSILTKKKHKQQNLPQKRSVCPPPWASHPRWRGGRAVKVWAGEGVFRGEYCWEWGGPGDPRGRSFTRPGVLHGGLFVFFCFSAVFFRVKPPQPGFVPQKFKGGTSPGQGFVGGGGRENTAPTRGAGGENHPGKNTKSDGGSLGPAGLGGAGPLFFPQNPTGSRQQGGRGGRGGGGEPGF